MLHDARSALGLPRSNLTFTPHPRHSLSAKLTTHHLTMKSLPAPLQSHLDTGATTLAWCWRVTRNDGTHLGFTDHDRDLAFDGTVFEASTGFTASEIKDAL